MKLPAPVRKQRRQSCDPTLQFSEQDLHDQRDNAGFVVHVGLQVSKPRIGEVHRLRLSEPGMVGRVAVVRANRALRPNFGDSRRESRRVEPLVVDHIPIAASRFLRHGFAPRVIPPRASSWCFGDFARSMSWSFSNETDSNPRPRFGKYAARAALRWVPPRSYCKPLSTKFVHGVPP